ncbi:MAG: 8-oxoguanine deaminase [Sumerlaeia bacterium]
MSQPERLLIENCRHIATMDDQERELRGQDILIEGNRVAAIGPNLRAAMPERIPADTPAIDASSHLVLPGFVNCHHHLWQVLTRVLPRVQNAELFEWLVENYKVWENCDPDAIYTGALLSQSELILTGCTTSTDHHYLFPVAQPVELLDETFRAAADLGLRFYPTRGSMTLGVDDGGLPPMTLTEDPERVLADYDRVVSKYHNPVDDAMTRVHLAPCAPFNAKEELFRETARLATHYKVRIHTHLAETSDEDVYCLERFGCRPFEYVRRLGWDGGNVWFAHCVKLNSEEIRHFADAGIGVAHCPSANARLGSGVAPVPEMLEAGVKVGLAVDGTSSNDSGSLLGEAAFALKVHRATWGVHSLQARDVLRMLTRGGAAVLDNPSLGQIAEGCPADIVLFDLDQYGYAGGPSTDPVAGLLMCGTNTHVDYSIINGKIVVERGKICGQSEKTVVCRANVTTARLTAAARAKHGIDFTELVQWPKKG